MTNQSIIPMKLKKKIRKTN